MILHGIGWADWHVEGWTRAEWSRTLPSRILAVPPFPYSGELWTPLTSCYFPLRVCIMTSFFCFVKTRWTPLWALWPLTYWLLLLLYRLFFYLSVTPLPSLSDSAMLSLTGLLQDRLGIGLVPNRMLLSVGDAAGISGSVCWFAIVWELGSILLMRGGSYKKKGVAGIAETNQ